MARKRIARAGAAAVTLAISLAACGGGGSDGPPQDPWEHLMQACTTWAEVVCQKNAACIPPVDPNCMSTQLASCLDDGQQGGPTCVPTAASAIDGCAAKFPATTCSDYCTTSTSGKICLAPCIWLC
ncbi:MAG TPA: hypothetical protein VN903_24915 [Polyangia bacterium]|jgi:hypothetical protein|nr:hypothetical protein [Polyangia bacterium]